MLIDLGNDHDIFGEASESTAASTNAVPVTDLLSIDQLLETVCLALLNSFSMFLLYSSDEVTWHE